jgi:hypothetical protein
LINVMLLEEAIVVVVFLVEKEVDVNWIIVVGVLVKVVEVVEDELDLELVFVEEVAGVFRIMNSKGWKISYY